MKRKQESSSNNTNFIIHHFKPDDFYEDYDDNGEMFNINSVYDNDDIEAPMNKKLSIMNNPKENIENVVAPKLSAKDRNLKYQMNRLPYSSSEWNKNDCFNKKSPPNIIDYTTGDVIIDKFFPDDWSNKESAKNAILKAKQRKPNALHSILMGSVNIHLSDCSEELVKELVLENIIDDEIMDEFDDDGEFNTPTGQIPVSRLMDEIEKFNNNDRILLKSLFALQSPVSSQWNLPFIRLISNHDYCDISKKLHVKIYIYFTRLIFELIADDAIKCIMDRIENIPARVIEVQKQIPQPILFKSPQAEARHHSLPSYRFSLAGLLKNAESQGYDFTNTQQPQGLNVELFEFQLSTYQWMLDQERNKRGLNSYFWEEYHFSYGLSLYYFPLAGEFRLIKPPITTGGLLCEEMGLGKVSIYLFLFIYL
jgi:hypothetical protein